MENPEGVTMQDALILLHPSFPVKLLRDVFNKIKYDSQFYKDWSYIFKAIENPNFPTEFLEDLVEHTNTAVRALVASHPNTSPEALEQLSTDKGAPRWMSWNPQEQVALNPHTPPHVLSTMALSPEIKVRKKVARNLSTPVETLKAMVSENRAPTIKPIALYTLFKLGQVKFTIDS